MKGKKTYSEKPEYAVGDRVVVERSFPDFSKRNLWIGYIKRVNEEINHSGNPWKYSTKIFYEIDYAASQYPAPKPPRVVFQRSPSFTRIIRKLDQKETLENLF